MFIETRISRLVKKTGVKKSRWTVPLMLVKWMDTVTFIVQYSIHTHLVQQSKCSMSSLLEKQMLIYSVNTTVNTLQGS